MPSMRVHELAKEFGMSSKELLDRLQEMKIPAKNHASTLVEAYVDKIRKQMGPEIAERQAALEAEREKKEAAEAAKREAEEAARRADEDARRAAEEEERLAREEERVRLEQEAEERRARDEAARAEAERLAAEAAAAEAARQAAEAAAAVERQEAERYREMARAAEEAAKRQNVAPVTAPQPGATPTATPTPVPTGPGGKKKKSKKPSGRRETGRQPMSQQTVTPEEAGVVGSAGEHIVVQEGTTVGAFAEVVGLSPTDIIKHLMLKGQLLTVNQPLSKQLVNTLAEDLGYTVDIVSVDEEIAEEEIVDNPEDLVTKAPVVTVMGHVDHGKTSLLDAIRSTGVQATEAGGITQHIGASVVEKNGRKITFIDTPGHEAFTSLRARGANVTDVVVLVVAADDGVMPQTVEAIDHAKAAGVPILVAVNKIDKDNANVDRVRQELADHAVMPEEWGGNNVFVNVSAKKMVAIDELLEMILLVADLQELKANPDAPARGVVIEAKLERGRGPVATVLVQRGTLRIGDAVVAGTSYGRVRALVDSKGKAVKTAGPADPVEIVGLASVPSGGDEFKVMVDERAARAIAEERAMKRRLAAEQQKKHISLDAMFDAIQSGVQDINLLVKADANGSIEAIKDALSKIDQTEVRINVLRAAVGGITETDVDLADASDAIVIGFNVRPEPKAKVLAEQTKVDMRLYRVIYKLIEDINAARVGMLAPTIEEQDTARIEVREVFRVPKIGAIAGSYVTDGEISRDDQVRIVRDGTIIWDGKIGSLRRFKEDVRSVRAGYECGVGIDNFQDIKEGDVIEGYKTIEVAREA